MLEQLPLLLAVYALPTLLAITIHEAAHGYVARLCGDDTADRAGRITLNPLKHIDPVGTILVPLGLLLLGKLTGTSPILLGWAKPVPVDFSRLRFPQRDMRYVAFAGPASNILMAMSWAMLFKLSDGFDGGDALARWFSSMAIAGISVNIILAALNLLPILPLDGGRIVTSYLPVRWAMVWARTEPYGLMVLLLLMATNVLHIVMAPLIQLGQAIVGVLL